MAELVSEVKDSGKLPLGRQTGLTVQFGKCAQSRLYYGHWALCCHQHLLKLADLSWLADFADNAAVQSCFETGDAGHVLQNVITAFNPASVTGKRQRQSGHDGPRKR